MISSSLLEALLIRAEGPPSPPRPAAPRCRTEAALAADVTVTIRFACPRDERAVAAIAQMDERTLADGERLIAEIDGRVVAVLGLLDGVAAADPFERSEAAVQLLRMRARQLHAAGLHQRPMMRRITGRLGIAR